MARGPWAAGPCPDTAFAGCRDILLTSSDGGRRWKTRASRRLLSLSFVDAGHGWAIGPAVPAGTHGPSRLSLLVASNGGISWRTVAGTICHGYGAPQGVSFVSPMQGWVGCAAVAGAGQSAAKAVVETTDGGRSWQVTAGRAAPGAGNLPAIGSLGLSDYLTGIAMRPFGSGLIWQGRGSTLVTRDSGTTWTDAPPGQPDVVIVHDVAMASDNTSYALLVDGNSSEQTLELTRDAGFHWSLVSVIPGPNGY